MDALVTVNFVYGVPLSVTIISLYMYVLVPRELTVANGMLKICDVLLLIWPIQRNTGRMGGVFTEYCTILAHGLPTAIHAACDFKQFNAKWPGRESLKQWRNGANPPVTPPFYYPLLLHISEDFFAFSHPFQISVV